MADTPDLGDWTIIGDEAWGSRDAYGDYDPRSWDTVVWVSETGKINLPGVATVKVDSSINIDVRTTQNADGSVFVYQGTPPKDFSITFTCWHPTQMSLWETILPRMILSSKELRRVAKTPSDSTLVSVPSFDFAHPVLAANRIARVVIFKVSGPNVEPAGGKFTVEISGKEFTKFLPRGKVFTANASDSDPAIYDQKTPPTAANKPPSASVASRGPR